MCVREMERCIICRRFGEVSEFVCHVVVVVVVVVVKVRCRQNK